MKKLILIMGLMLLLAPAPLNSQNKEQIKQTLNSAGVLYGQLRDHKQFLCSTFTFSKDGEKYALGTASHCVADPDSPPDIVFSVIVNQKEYPVKLLAAGGSHSELGDVAILELDTKDSLGVTPLSTEEVTYGDRVFYVGCPQFAEKQLYSGLVAAPKINLAKDAADDEDDAPAAWNDVMLTSLATGPGASGAGVVSEKTGQIVGIVLGHSPHTVGVAIVGRIEQLTKLQNKAPEIPLVNNNVL